MSAKMYENGIITYSYNIVAEAAGRVAENTYATPVSFGAN
jgi:hypothetical protein